MKESYCVVLGVTGSIAAYKAAEIASSLKKQNVAGRPVEVHAIMTQAATAFLAPLTLETLSGHAVITELFSRETPWEVEHIALAKRADVFLVAPTTANFLGKYAHGIADDMLTTTVMATKAPVVIAPAMNENMLLSAATQENIAILKERGVSFIESEHGHLACGDVGMGKLASVDAIVRYTLAILRQSASPPANNASRKEQDLLDKTLLISAGPTREALDPVRYISNRSSGKMGYALAQAALARGAKVTLVSGPVALRPPEGASLVSVQSTAEMYDAMLANFEGCDICIMAAAPADFTPARYEDQKIKKNGGTRFKALNEAGALENVAFEFTHTPDILFAMGQAKARQFLCGFAAETQGLETYANDKLARKNLDMIVANDVSKPGVGFDGDTNAVSVYLKSGERREFPLADKREIADALLDIIVRQIP